MEVCNGKDRKVVRDAKNGWFQRKAVEASAGRNGGEGSVEMHQRHSEEQGRAGPHERGLL